MCRRVRRPHPGPAPQLQPHSPRGCVPSCSPVDTRVPGRDRTGPSQAAWSTFLPTPVSWTSCPPGDRLATLQTNKVFYFVYCYDSLVQAASVSPTLSPRHLGAGPQSPLPRENPLDLLGLGKEDPEELGIPAPPGGPGEACPLVDAERRGAAGCPVAEGWGPELNPSLWR